MIWLVATSLLLAAIPALLFLANLRLLLPPPHEQAGERRAAVLIPARDEEENIESAVQAALASGAAEVIVLDDSSRDRTGDIVRQISATDSRLRLLEGTRLPPGWFGKNYACAQLAATARETVLIFADADLCLAPGSAPRLVATLERSGASMVSGVPRQITVTFSERLLIPLIHFLLLGFLPFGAMRRSRRPAYGAACGQLIVVDAAAYSASGGHDSIRACIHDGLALPKSFRRHGLGTDLFDATEVAVCRMYRTDAEVWRGLTKNTHEGLGSPALIGPMSAMLLLGQVAPWFFLFFSHDLKVRALAAVAIAFSLLVRLCATVRFRQSLGGALLHPIAILALVGLQWFGLARYLFRQPASWKGRSYATRAS